MIRASDEPEDELEIRQKMELVRKSLAGDREGIQQAKSDLLNPRKVAARNPLLTVGVATALGFLLAPKLGEPRKNGPTHPAKLLDEMPPVAKPDKGRPLMATLFATAISTAGRVALGIASRKLAEHFVNKAASKLATAESVANAEETFFQPGDEAGI